MFTSELAKLVGVTPETVRFYTRQGLLKAVKQPSNGYRVYDQTAVTHLTFITHATAIGFSLKEVQDIMQSSEQGKSPCPQVRQMLRHKIVETEQKIVSLTAHLSMMKTTLSDWADKEDTVPNGQEICCLIEDWSGQNTVSPAKEDDRHQDEEK
ncbi:MerR family transcriptional regulator [Marinomonas algarum]|uniref:MerR family transcriptional regulator n=1 Tax=Marinomonas algarum TaxID=2883105 RepID=A0A9X1LE60_9GAMM|nr:MerR family transcriptional regulator [Marinomonas algarum]MCB5160948.1 MerR family transcriptional regulator [Marinomonas algarum]